MGVVFEHYGPVVVPSSKHLSLPPARKTTPKLSGKEATPRLPSTSTILNKLSIPAEDLRLQDGCLDFLKFLDDRDVRRAVFNRADASHLRRLNELIGNELAFPLQFENDIFHRRVKPQSVFVVAKKWGFTPPNLLFVSSSTRLLSRLKSTGILTCLLTGDEEAGTRLALDPPSSYSYDQQRYGVEPLKKPKAQPPRSFVPDLTVRNYSELRSKLVGGEAKAEYIEAVNFKDVEIAKLLSFANQKISFSRE